jgi:hypothetical protein
VINLVIDNYAQVSSFLSLSLSRSLSLSLARSLSLTHQHTHTFRERVAVFFFFVFFCVCAKFPSYLRGGDFNGFLTYALLCSCSSIFPARSVVRGGSCGFLTLKSCSSIFFCCSSIFFSRSVVRGGSWRRQSCAGPTS